MWFLLSRRIRAYLFFALGAPLVAWLLHSLGARLEARRGPTRVSRALQWAGRRLDRRSRGPLTRRTRRRTQDPGEQGQA